MSNSIELLAPNLAPAKATAVANANSRCLTVPSESRALLFAITNTPDDADDLRRLPHDVIKDTRIRLARLKRIHDSGNVKRECERLAAELQRLSASKGNSAVRLRADYYAYTSKGAKGYAPGDWRCIVNWAKAGPRGRNEGGEVLPESFLKFWRKLCDDYQRVSSEAWRELIRIWETGFDSNRKKFKAIEGYEAWPAADPATGYPVGWSYGNLMRHSPDEYERKAARIGIQAASGVGLKLRFQRTGVAFFEYVSFDDHEFNVKVNFPGQVRSMRPRCFGAADYLTSCCFNLAIKPTLWDAEAEAKRILTETDFMWYVVAILTEFGYRADHGTKFLVEHGTAAIRGNKALPITSALRDDFEKRIFDVTGGMVTVERSGRFHKQAHGGQFAAPSGGNFRFKPIEQYWRMIDDRLAALPGQTGLDRNHSPEESTRADAYVAKLLKAAQSMPVEKAAQLIIPRLTWNEFTQFAFTKQWEINADIDHAIRNWDKCGFLAKEWRAAENAPWQSEAALRQLSDEQRAAVLALVSHNDLLFRVRKLSRAEAFARHAGELVKVGPEMIPALVGPRNALRGGEPVPVINGTLSFKDWRIQADPLVFIACDEQGKRFREGDKFVCYCNPMAPTSLVACDPVGRRVVAICQPMPEPAKNDAEGVQRAMGMQNNWHARALAEMRERHLADAEAIDFMKRHNAALLPERIPTPRPAEPVSDIADGRADILAQEPAPESTEEWK